MFGRLLEIAQEYEHERNKWSLHIATKMQLK